MRQSKQFKLKRTPIHLKSFGGKDSRVNSSLISCKKPINNCIGYDKHKTSNDKCKSIGIKERSKCYKRKIGTNNNKST